MSSVAIGLLAERESVIRPFHETSSRTHTPHAVMEAALAHVVRNKAEAACARSDHFEKRRALMES